ncbi:hypothetical protein DPEC_G00201540 [Dallia pectoralis]|uniref:Uncharacterized protein n=1 Tax=Dallia pectoralis TaxID=75939 RepID=A0ACC2G8U2_DALPE|nr:hypothetical protein DPEC_G00201540 [Dallia pectoralis]
MWEYKTFKSLPRCLNNAYNLYRKINKLTNFNMNVFILLILGIGRLQTGSAVTHSLKQFMTGISGDTDFPEFTGVGLLDTCQVAYVDRNTNTVVPSDEWVKRVISDYWERHTHRADDARQFFKNIMPVLRTLFNQSMSTGVYALQVMIGCEWDDETGVTDGFFNFGYDGEDFISFDLETLTWIASGEQAGRIKHVWDNEKAENEYWKTYVTQYCIDWLKTFLEYGRSILMRTVAPSVSLL